MKQISIEKGDIFLINFDPSMETETKKTRPALVLSNKMMNENLSRIIVAPITSNVSKIYRWEYLLKNTKNVKGKIMLDQMRSIDRCRIKKKLDHIDIDQEHEINSIIIFLLNL